MMPVIPRTKKTELKTEKQAHIHAAQEFTCSCVHVLKWQGKVQMLRVLLLTLNRTCLSLTFQPVIFFTYTSCGCMCLEYMTVAAIMHPCMFGLSLLPIVVQMR